MGKGKCRARVFPWDPLGCVGLPRGWGSIVVFPRDRTDRHQVRQGQREGRRPLREGPAPAGGGTRASQPRAALQGAGERHEGRAGSPRDGRPQGALRVGGDERAECGARPVGRAGGGIASAQRGFPRGGRTGGARGVRAGHGVLRPASDPGATAAWDAAPAGEHIAEPHRAGEVNARPLPCGRRGAFNGGISGDYGSTCGWTI